MAAPARDMEMEVKLIHHGAAATSCTKVLTWLNNTSTSTCARPTLAYASHAMINVTRPIAVTMQPDRPEQHEEWIWNVQETLRTKLSYSTSPTDSKPPTITALTTVKSMSLSESTTATTMMVAGFSNGSLSLWTRRTDAAWEEQVLMDALQIQGQAQQKPESEQEVELSHSCCSITDLSSVVLPSYTHPSRVLLATCSSAGVVFHSYKTDTDTLSRHVVSHHPTATLQWQALSETTLLLLVGTAAPRHNKIMIYSLSVDHNNNNKDAPTSPHYCGALLGHEDWITCLAWQSLPQQQQQAQGGFVMASGSQDWKIRLWKFTTLEDAVVAEQDSRNPSDEDQDEEEDLEEHESRMEIPWQHQQRSYQTSVSLEALLLGHEGPVTAVEWYPSTTTTTNSDAPSLILLSSSMDRSILLWSPSLDDGIWTPMTRVGSAGGILGGSVGSTLLGYLNLVIQPPWLIGHAYGGALHIWHNNSSSSSLTTHPPQQQQQGWKATPCLTGHFDGITDLCWEATFGEYLLTVSLDQTCRLWAPLQSHDNSNNNKTVWVEIARPQVHGYNLSAVTSLSSKQHRHWMVSGADEKELRILDAPMTTVRLLQATRPPQNADEKDNDVERVERAYIPSLGLSNKATATDGAEEDVLEDVEDDGDVDPDKVSRKAAVHLPLERDLGALSLWLETRKLFGHNTELYCVTSTLEAKTAVPGHDDDPYPVLVASTTKARDVDAAAIRLWNPTSGECVQVLSGGHKATVVTLSFSPDGGTYLASSGKDRRLCLWKRSTDPSTSPSYHLAAAKDTAHKRIVWSVHFCPFDATVLASGSRDGNIKVWKLSEANDDALAMETLFSFAPVTQNHAQKPDSVTALAFAPQPLPRKSHALMAVGLECGLIEMWSIPMGGSAMPATVPQLLQRLSENVCHVATVTKLSWRPLRDNVSQVLTLASGSADHGCRIYEIDTATGRS